MVTPRATDSAALVPPIQLASPLSQATRTVAQSAKAFSFDAANRRVLALEMSREFQLGLAKVFSLDAATPLVLG